MPKQVEPLGTKQVAETLRVSRRTVRRLVEAGELNPLHKMTGTTGAYLFDAAEVERVRLARLGMAESAA